MSNGVVDVDLVQHGAVVKRDGDSVRDEALLRLMVVGTEGGVLDACDLVAEGVDAGVSGRFVRAAQMVERGTLKRYCARTSPQS